VPPEELGGNALVYLPRYVTVDDPLFENSDAEIERRFLSALATMYPDLARSDVRAFQISRVRHVLAVSTLDYSERLPSMQTSVPGVFIVNSAHIVNGTLNVDQSVELANRAIKTLLGGLDSPMAESPMSAEEAA